MASIEEAIRRLIFEYVSEGADEVIKQQEQVAASTTKTDKASLSLEKSFGSLERRYVETVRHQQDYAKVQEKVNAAVAQNPALQDRANVLLAAAAGHYDKLAEKASKGGIASSFLSKAITTVIGPAGLLGVATTAVGAAVGYMAAKFESASTTIEQALEEQNRLLKEGKTLIDAKASAEAKFNAQPPNVTRFENLRNELDLAKKLIEASEKMQSKVTTPTSLGMPEMGIAPELSTAPAPGLEKARAAIEDLVRSIQEGKPRITEFVDELARIAIANPELAKTTEEIIKMGGPALEQAVFKARALEAALNGVATAAQLAALGYASMAQFQVGNQMAIEAAAATERQAVATQQLMALYPGMTIEGAKQLQQAQQATTLATARTGAEKLVAQELVTQQRLIASGVVPAEEAARIAAEQRTTAEENVKRAIEGQIKSLEDQVRLSRARQNGTEASVKAEIAYERAIASGSGEALAGQLRDQTLRVERIREAEAAEREVADAVQTTQSMQVSAHNQQMSAIAETRAANNASFAEMAEKTKFMTGLWLGLQNAITGAFSVTSYGSSKIFTTPSGGYSQFDPEGYVSGILHPISASKETPAEAAERMWGPGGFEKVEPLSKWGLGANIEKFEPTLQGRQFIQQQAIEAGLQVGDTLQDAFQKTLQAPFEESNQLMQQIIALAGPAEQTSMLQQAIERAREQPTTLANEQLIKQLTDQLKGLTTSTDSLNATMQSALSPYYSQDPRTTKLGFRAGVKGNPAWMTGATNESPLDAILGPGAIAPTTGTVTTPKLTGGAIMLPPGGYTGGRTGFASGGSFTVPGGYSATDNKIAQFPVASGERVTVDRKGTQPNVVNIDNRIVIVGGVDQNTLGKFKVSRYQQGQKIRASMAG